MHKEYDAIYIHGQGYKPERKTLPSKRGRLQALAVRTMLRRGFTFDNFLFSGVKFKGESTSMADINAGALQRRAHVDSSRMIIDQAARITSMEVAFAERQARTHGWKRVMHLTYGKVHADQIRQHVEKKYAGSGIEVDIFRADEVLTDPTDVGTTQDQRNLARYQSYINAYDQSPTEQDILVYERRKYMFMNWPFDLGDKVLELVSKFYRPDPSQSQSG